MDTVRKGITGTFLDEISHDIPSASWGPKEWAADFDAMKAVGIDTVILIRCGHKDQATFNSRVLKAHQPMRPVYTDLVQVFLDESQRCGMTFFFGTYDSGRYWHGGQADKETELNIALADEVGERYASHPAFGGWYISHEVNTVNNDVMEMYRREAAHLKSIKDIPILISPYIRGRKQFSGDQLTSLAQHEKEWEAAFAAMAGHVDLIAFQDGHVDFLELPGYLEINARLARKYGITCWSNVETFERGMPINFLPIAWPNLRFKMEAALAAGVDKLITFEFSHFMSPNSVYPAAHNLYRRYQEWLSAR